VESNGVFATLPPDLLSDLEFDSEGNRAFHIWDAGAGVARLMCSWDTAPEDIDAFTARARDAADRAISQRA
jgi:threonine aldolase